MRISVSIPNLDRVVKSFDTRHIAQEVDRVTETYVRKMANAAAGRAPVKNGWLRSSIIASVRPHERGVWSFGSSLEYARRQEYEHRTNRGFIRKTVFEYRNEYRDAVREALRQIGAG